MDDWELAIELRKERGIEEVWNGHAFLTLDENGVPILETWYQLEQNGERIDEIYKYIDGKWILQEEREDEGGDKYV